VFNIAFPVVERLFEGYIKPEVSIRELLKEPIRSLNQPPMNFLLWSQLTARWNGKVFSIQARMFDTNNLPIVADKEIRYVSKFTRGFINPTEQFKKEAEIIFLIVCHFAKSL
jgi:hypothetical protein